MSVEKPTVSFENLTVSLDKSTASLEKPTVSLEKSAVSPGKLAFQANCITWKVGLKSLLCHLKTNCVTWQANCATQKPTVSLVPLGESAISFKIQLRPQKLTGSLSK